MAIRAQPGASYDQLPQSPDLGCDLMSSQQGTGTQIECRALQLLWVRRSNVLPRLPPDELNLRSRSQRNPLPTFCHRHGRRPLPWNTLSSTLLCSTASLLAIDAVNQGHPPTQGCPMGAAPDACPLGQGAQPQARRTRNGNRDRFRALSRHGCMLPLFPSPSDGTRASGLETQAFRQWGSRTPGLPGNLRDPGR